MTTKATQNQSKTTTKKGERAKPDPKTKQTVGKKQSAKAKAEKKTGEPSGKKTAKTTAQGRQQVQASKAKAEPNGGEQRIKVLAKENPHRKGTHRHERFEFLRKKTRTVAEYREQGYPAKYLRYLQDTGLAKIG